MPSYGEKQMSAGKVLNNAKPIVGTRKMKANNSTITPTLGGVENIEYKGNPVLNANRS
jgi:hypothetical protein